MARGGGTDIATGRLIHPAAKGKDESARSVELLNLVLATVPPAGFAESEPGYLLGTDGLGRDVLSRVIFGTQVSLTVAFVAAGLACLIGSLLGLLAGFLGGWVEVVISRLVEIWMAFPPVLLSILLVAVLGTGLHSVIAAIVVIDWTRFCRVVRTETMGQAQMDYVVAARTIGFARPAILFREILPNCMPAILTKMTIDVGFVILIASSMSFLGLGAQAPTPDLGSMVADGAKYMPDSWWLTIFPALAILLIVLGFNLLGDGLRDMLDVEI